MSRFVVEVRKVNGAEYPGKTVLEMVEGIQRYLLKHGVQYSFRQDKQCQTYRALDAIIRDRGKGTIPKTITEMIDEADEEWMWQNGLLGHEYPEQLINTLIWQMTKAFGLQDYDHRQLVFSRFESGMETNGQVYLDLKCYSKNNGAVFERKMRYLSNATRRCLIYTYLQYLKHIPAFLPITSALYLQPKETVYGSVWYDRKPLGRVAICEIIGRLASSTDIARKIAEFNDNQENQDNVTCISPNFYSCCAKSS